MTQSNRKGTNSKKSGSNETGAPKDKQFIIAAIFIVGFYASLAIGFYIFFLTSNTQVLTFVGTLFGGWLGSIIGYYFGQKPVEQERKRVDDLTEQLKKRSNDMWARLERNIPRKKGGGQK